MQATKAHIRQRAQACGIVLGPAIKQAGVFAWWRAAPVIDRKAPEWQAAERLIDFGTHSPDDLFAPVEALPRQVVVPVEPPAQPKPPTLWRRVKGYFGRKA